MSFTDFHFIRPLWFIALIPVILLIALSLRNKLAHGNWSTICDDALLPFILENNDNNSRHHGSLITLSIASILAIIALAGPTSDRLPTPVFRNDAAVVIALDLSQSMNATDIKPTRLVRAHYKIADIVQQRKDGLTALIAYAGDAFTVVPLTNDTATITSQINALTTDIMPSQGSNTLDAISKSVSLLQQAGQTEGSILLITDGIDKRDINKAKALLANYNLSILGVGTEEGAPIKLAHGGFLQDLKGNIVIPKLDVAALSSLTQQGGGIYLSISSDDSDSEQLLSHTGQARSDKASKQDDTMVEQWAELGPWLVLLLLPITAIYFRKGLLIIPLVMVMNYPQDSYAFEWQDLWQTQDQQAQKAFDAGNYEEAAELFQNPEWKAAAEYRAAKYRASSNTFEGLEQESANDHYNKATSLAKSGELEASLAEYEKSLKLNPKHPDALYNKKIVEDALKKQQEQQQNDEDSKAGDKEKEEKNNQSQQSKPQQGKSDDEQSETGEEQQDQQSENAGNQKRQEQEQKESDAEQKQQEAGQNSDKQKDEDSDNSESQSAQQQTKPMSDEEKQAQEQWLNRITDDPSNLLKRKFKYQYNQRNQRSQQGQTW